MSESTLSQYKQTEECGVNIIRDFNSKMNPTPTEKAAADASACGIDIVRSFMNQERSEYGWPGSNVTKLSKPRRSSRTPNAKAYDSNTKVYDNSSALPSSRSSFSDEAETPTWRRAATPAKEYHQPQFNEVQKSPCKFFFSPTGCRFGHECHFAHADRDHELEEEALYSEAVPICPFFIAGFCRFGEQCCYAHVEPEALQDQQYYENYAGYPMAMEGQEEEDDQEAWAGEQSQDESSNRGGFSSLTESVSEEEESSADTSRRPSADSSQGDVAQAQKE